MTTVFQMPVFACRACWTIAAMPIDTLTTLAQSAASGSWRTQTRTHRGKEHEAGESGDKGVRGVECVAKVELEGAGVRHWGELVRYQAKN